MAMERMYKWFIFVVIAGGIVLLLGHYILNDSSLAAAPSLLSSLPSVIPSQATRVVAQPHVTTFSCRKLFDGDEKEKENAYVSMRYPRPVIPDAGYILPRESCKQFIYSRGYTMDAMTDEERAYPLAFSILMFKDVAQVERLLRAIYRPQNYYCIHVDKKANSYVHKAMKSIAACFPNVFMALRVYDVHWGEMGVLEAELECMRNLLNYKSWRYFINLTGQEFPLKTNWELVKILKVYNGANDMEGTVERRNVERTLFVHDKEGYRTTKRKALPPHTIRLTKGSVHITASRDFVDFVINDQKAKDFLDWVTDTGIPDETFFSSLDHSPHIGVPGSYSGRPETDPVFRPFMTRFKNWGMYPFDWPCAGQRIRMVCVFGIGDLPLLANRPELFANKFYTDFQPLTYDCMEELHFNRTRDEYAGVAIFNTSFYEHLPFIYKKNSEIQAL